MAEALERARDALSSLWSGLLMLLMLPLRGAGFLGRQLRGTASRTRGFVGWLSFDRLMPSGVASTIQEVFTLVPQALGIRGTSRMKQFSAAVILGVLAYFATFLTGGLLIGAAIFLTLMVVVAVARNVPAVDGTWRDWTAALGIKRDYDIPAWKRD